VTLRCPQARQLLGGPVMLLISQISANVMPERDRLKGLRRDRCKPSMCLRRPSWYTSLKSLGQVRS
jgi:hypothetical protein